MKRTLLKSTFDKVHNEYLQVMSSMGIIGLGLFIASILFMIKESFLSYFSNINTPEVVTLLCSFVCISLIAFGTFVWQISPHNFYTVVIVGLLHNRRILKGELQ